MTGCRSPLRGVTRRRAMTLAEAVMAMLIVSVMLLAALDLVSSSRLSEKILADQCIAESLAEDLMAEILNQPYADPVDGVASFGRTSAENAPGDRSLFDDIDDYDEWSESPPARKDGTEMNDYAGWSREVVVDRVEQSDLSSVAASDKGIKRIVVTIKQDGRAAATLTAFRTSAWQTGLASSD